MKHVLLVAIVALVSASGSASADQSSLNGAWTAKVPAPNGQATFDVRFTFKVDGGKLTGTASAGGEAYALVDTRITADNIAFAVEGEPARYTGTVAGDEIRMKVTFKSSENGTRTWSFVAKRAAPAAAAPASIDGEWSGEVPRGGGRFIAANIQFHADGSTLTGVVRALDDEFPVTNGTINGSRIAFTIGDTKGEYSGELAGDTVRMRVKYDGGENGRQTLDFVLKRARSTRS